MTRMFLALPYGLRVAAASLKGYQLRHQRYGAGADDRIGEVLERDHWTAEQWKRWQDGKLAGLLDRAATKVPWYREHWRRRRQAGDRSSWEMLANWPILEKGEFRGNSHAFIAEDADRRRLVHTVTSGTTGSPTDFWVSGEAQREWYARFDARCRHWHGLTRHQRWAHVGGKVVAPMEARKPPFWVWNQGLSQLYLSSYHLIPGQIRHYAEAMRKHRVEYLLGYSSSIYEIAAGCLAEGIRDLRLRAVISESEQVYEHQRRAVREAFGCELKESYGMVEMAAAASECGHGSMHLWPDAGVLEVVEGNSELPAGMTGDFVCTGLLNQDVPLIRFRVGDRGALASSGARCECGRTLPMLREIEGRISDMLITRDGRRLAPANVECIYDDHHPVREAQLVQHSLDRVTLRYVPADGFTPEAEERLRRAIRNHLGPVEVTMEPMLRLPRGANGKLRAVICLMPPEEREAALRL